MGLERIRQAQVMSLSDNNRVANVREFNSRNVFFVMRSFNNKAQFDALEQGDAIEFSRDNIGGVTEFKILECK